MAGAIAAAVAGRRCCRSKRSLQKQAEAQVFAGDGGGVRRGGEMQLVQRNFYRV